jgi:hypothetical protein
VNEGNKDIFFSGWQGLCCLGCLLLKILPALIRVICAIRGSIFVAFGSYEKSLIGHPMPE